MNVPSKILKSNKDLTRRYLIWCYKTTKEDLDRIDRYYTQLKVDEFLLQHLTSQKAAECKDESYKALVKDFEKYMFAKKENVDQKKYKDVAANVLNPQYVYLKQRFIAIEKAIVSFLGRKELTKITASYEQEMTRRILEARDHS